MSNLPVIIQRALDEEGDGVYSGAKLFTYKTGTTTDKATYPTLADRNAATNANANPVIADSAGRFGEVWLLTDEAYTFVLKTTADVTVWTHDIQWAVETAADGAATRLKLFAEDPVRHGGVGDGASDERTEVQAAIDAAIASGIGVVDLLGLTWRCDSALDLDLVPTNFKLKNGTINFSSSSATEHIQAHGALSGSARALSTNASYLDETVATVSFPVGVAGNLVFLSSTGTYCAQETLGEIQTLDAIATLTHTLSKYVQSDYATADTAQLQAITSIDELIFEDLIIIGSTTQSGTDPTFISAIMCRQLTIRNCSFTGMKQTAVRLGSCFGVEIEDCAFANGLGTAVNVIGAASDILVEDCRFERVVTGFATNAVHAQGSAITGSANGQESHITVENCRFEQCATMVNVDYNSRHVDLRNLRSHNGGGITANCVDLTIDDVRVIDPNATGIQVLTRVPQETSRGYSVEVRRCDLRGNSSCDIDVAPQGYGATGSGQLATLEIVDNKVREGVIDVLIGTASTDAGSDEVVIRGNKVPAGKIEITGGDTLALVSDLEITGNRCLNIKVDGTDDSFPEVLVSQNRVSGAFNGSHIDIDNCDYVDVSDNRVIGDASTSDNGIDVQDCNNVHITNNRVRGLTESGTNAGIYVDDCGPLIEIIGNRVSTLGYGLYLGPITNQTDVLVVGNSLTGSVYGMRFVGGTGIYSTVFTGNKFHSTGADTTDHGVLYTVTSTSATFHAFTGNSFETDAAAAAGINIVSQSGAEGTFTGNVFVDGAEGIQFASGDSEGDWAVAGNMFEMNDPLDGTGGQPSEGNAYAFTNVTTDRDYDADGPPSNDVLADTLATLVIDLQANGSLPGY